MKYLYFLMIIFVFAGCENFKDIEVGKEGAACFGNGTCRKGLVCDDGKCVKPDEAKNDDDSGNTGNTGDSGNSGNTGDTGNTAGDEDTGNTGDSGNSGDSGDSGDDDIIGVDTDDIELDDDVTETDDSDTISDGSDRIVLFAHDKDDIRSIYMLTKRGAEISKLLSFSVPARFSYVACLSPLGDKMALLRKDLVPERMEIWSTKGVVEKLNELNISQLTPVSTELSRCDFLSEDRLVLGYYTTSGGACGNTSNRALSLWSLSVEGGTVLSTKAMGCTASENFSAVSQRESIFASFWPANWVPDNYIGELSLSGDTVSSWGTQTALPCASTDGHSKAFGAVSDSGNRFAFHYNKLAGYSGITQLYYCDTSSDTKNLILDCSVDDTPFSSSPLFLAEDKILVSCDRKSAYEINLENSLPINLQTCELNDSCIKWDLSGISTTLNKDSLVFLDSAPWNGDPLPFSVWLELHDTDVLYPGTLTTNAVDWSLPSCAFYTVTGKIHCTGGNYSQALQDHKILDLNTMIWSDGPAMTTGTYGHSLFQFDNKLWSIGGYTGFTGSKAVRYFDGTSWNNADSLTWNAHGVSSITNADKSKLIACGGFSNNCTQYGNCAYIESASQTWNTMDSLPNPPRAGGAMFFFSDMICYAGAGWAKGQCLADADADDIFCYNELLSTWEKVDDLPDQLLKQGDSVLFHVVVDDNRYIMGNAQDIFLKDTTKNIWEKIELRQFSTRTIFPRIDQHVLVKKDDYEYLVITAFFDGTDHRKPYVGRMLVCPFHEDCN